jgi:hypothetical protein
MADADNLDAGGLSFDEIKTWRVAALQEYLLKRGLRKEGRKEELIARVFAADEMGIALKKTAVELRGMRETEYGALLITPYGTLMDLRQIKDYWIQRIRA